MTKRHALHTLASIVMSLQIESARERGGTEEAGGRSEKRDRGVEMCKVGKKKGGGQRGVK